MSSTAQGGWYTEEAFSDMVGYRPGLEDFHKIGLVKWTNTASSLSTGGVHGLRYKVEKDGEGNPDIRLQHWVHWPGGKKPGDESSGQNTGTPHIISLKTESCVDKDGTRYIRPVAAYYGDKTFTRPKDIDQFMRFLQSVAKKLYSNITHNMGRDSVNGNGAESAGMRRDEIPNLYEIAEDTGFNKTIKLDGMYRNGEFNFRKGVNAGQEPVFPRQLARAMLGVEGLLAEKGDDTPFTKTYSVAKKEGGYEGVSFTYTPDKQQGFKVNCTVWSTDQNQKVQDETEIYRIALSPEGDDPDELKLTDLAMLEDERFSAPDLTNHKGVVRAMRAMKYVHLAIQQNEMPQISEIIDQHDLKSFLRTPHKPEEGPESPRQSFRLYTDPEGIGSNSVLMYFEFADKGGNHIKHSIGCDAGASFSDPDKDYYHSIAPDYWKNLSHPGSPHINPDSKKLVELIGHEHEDHLRGLARQVKFGFELPPVVLGQHARNSLDRMLKEEGVDSQDRAQVLEKCLVIDPANDGDVENPDSVKTHEYGDTIIEQGTESLWSEDEQRYKYFPVLTVYDKNHPDARYPVRIGPAGHSAHAMMFEIAGALYTGDYKLDQTLPEDRRTDLDWLARAGENASVHFQESTNALKEDTANPTAEEVAENRKQILRDHAGQPVFADMIGSNATDMFNFCEAIGELNQELPPGQRIDHIIFAGSAVKNKLTDLNKSHNLKLYMRKHYGIEILQYSEKGKKVQEVLSGNTAANHAVIGTGTQDEAVSISHRVSRGLHPSINVGPENLVLRLQAVIPSKMENFDIRREQNERFREECGATVYDANEQAENGCPIYHSSHTSKDDVREISKYICDQETGKQPVKVLFHGGAEQKQGMKDFLESETGASAMIPAPQGIYTIDHDARDVALIGETREQWSGYREIRGDRDAFFIKQRQQQIVHSMPEQWHGEAAEAIARFEVHAHNAEAPDYKPTARGANLHDDSEEARQNDFSGIGIYSTDTQRPYLDHYTKIGTIIGWDSETTGRDTNSAMITSASFVARDLEGNDLGVRSLAQALPDYRVYGPGAAIITGGINDLDKHYRRNKREGRYNQREFAYKMLDTFRSWPGELSEDPQKQNALFVTYRGAYFDDPITMRTLGQQLVANDMKPMSTYGNLTLDLYNVYSAFIALRPDAVGFQKDEDGNVIRTLEAACEANGIAYEGGHDDANDARMTIDLFEKFREIDPDLVEQMILNTDFKSSKESKMIDHILGHNQHPKDQMPVFGFVDRTDRECKPRLGALVTVDTTSSQATHAIVLDLAKADVHKLESLDDDTLKELMNDPDGPFSVIKLNQSPLIFPPEFVYNNAKVRGAAVGNIPKETIKDRANALKQLHENDAKPGQSFAQRIQTLYPRSYLGRAMPKAEPQQKQQQGQMPALGAPANQNTQEPSFQIPNTRIFSLFQFVNNFKMAKNKYRREAGNIVRDKLLPSREEMEDKSRGKDYWINAVKQVQDLDERARDENGNSDPYIADLRFLVEWMVDDMYPGALANGDKKRMNALKSAWLHTEIDRAYQEVKDIEEDPEQFKKLVGDDKGAKKRWEEMKQRYTDFLERLRNKHKFQYTQPKSLLVNKQRRDDAEKNRNRNALEKGKKPRLG